MNKEEIEKLLDIANQRINDLEGSIEMYQGMLEQTEQEEFNVQQENKQLKEQLEYIRSEEYYNQLRFERDMLQDLVDKGEISKEDKEFIDCTHRNTELLEENKQLKERIESLNKNIHNIEFENNWALTGRDIAIAEWKKMQQRIDKAIEYIESRARNAGVVLMPREKELIKILKGDSNDI